MSPRPNIKFNFDHLDNFKKELAAEAAKQERKVGDRVLFSDKFTVGEACAYVFVVCLTYGMLRFMGSLGLTMDMAVAAVLFTTLWEVIIAPRKIKYGERVLKVRELKQTGAQMEANSKKIENPWGDDENKFGLHLGDHIDYAVMKYVGDGVPHVVEQEYQHAKMHHSVQGDAKKDEEHQKWLLKNEPILNLFRKLALRRGDRVGRQVCGMFEAGNIYGQFLSALGGTVHGNVMNFHMFEECEHASVTVQSLKKGTTALERFLMFPLWMAFFLPFPFFAVLKFFEQPSLLLKPSAYGHFAYAFLKTSFGTVAALASIFFHWVLPVPMPATVVKYAWNHYRQTCVEGGVEWEVKKEATYPLYL